MESTGALALQTKMKWPLHQEDLACLIHSLCESRNGLEADVTKLQLGYMKSKYQNGLDYIVLIECKLTLGMYYKVQYRNCSYQH